MPLLGWFLYFSKVKAKLLNIQFCSILLSFGCILSFYSNSQTTRINLSRKHLKCIPEHVFEQKDLKVLRLYGNQIDSIPSEIGLLTNLEELYIGKNNLKYISPEIGKLKKLKILSAQYNEIDTLPKEIGELVSLEQLLLNQNKLTFLPSSIGTLKKLENLQLKFNSLITLPDELGDCSELKFLHLNRNYLNLLPASIGRLSKLKEIYLSGAGQLLEVPESFCDLRYLEILEIDQSTVVPSCLMVLRANRLTILQRSF